MCSADLLVETDPDDPVSVTRIAFNGKLMGFQTNVLKKQFVCILFSVCSFITLVGNMIAASNKPHLHGRKFLARLGFFFFFLIYFCLTDIY